MIKGRHLKQFALLASGAFIAVLTCLFLASETGFALLIILISFTLMITLGTFTWRNARENGIFDIVVLFSLFFLAYNVLLPLEVSLQYLLSHKIELNYPLQFGMEQFTLTAFLSLLGGIMFMIGTKLNLGFGSPAGSRIFAVKLNNNLSFYTGTILFVFGVLLFFLDYSRIGGYFNALAMDRVARLNLLSALRGNLPYFPFVLVGLSLMAYASLIKSKFKLRLGLTIVCSLFFISLLGIGGDRRYSLYVLLVLFSIYSFVRGPIRLNRQILLAGICVYFLFVIFENVRWMFPLILQGDLKSQTAYQLFVSDLSYALFLPGSTETAGPYLSLLWYATNTEYLLGGKSYLYAIPYLLPRSFYPGTKMPTISQDFALQIHEAFYYQTSGIVGWGFNPVAESLANFGFVGPIIVFPLIGLIFASANCLKKGGMTGKLILALLSPIAFNLNRADFANAFQEVIYYVALAFIVVIWVYVLQAATLKSSKAIRKHRKTAQPLIGGTLPSNLEGTK